MKQTILKLSKKYKLSHISSCLSLLPVLEEIYKRKRPEDKVLLDNAHAHLAHLLFITPDVEENLVRYGIHCDSRAGCDVSGGSLGHALGIAIGIALTDTKRDIYCVVSDGSMMEGSNWEALRLIDEWKVKNLKIYTNFNGYSAVDKVDLTKLKKRMKTFTKVNYRYTFNTKEFEGVEGHYKKI